MPERISPTHQEMKHLPEGRWKEKRREILGSLKKKVDFVNFLMDKSEQIGANGPDFAEKIDRVWDEGLGIFGEKIKAVVPEYFELDEERMRLAGLEMMEYEAIPEEVDPEEFGSGRSFDLGEKLEKVTDKMEELSDEDGHLEFILRMRDVKDGLLDKHDRIKKIPEDTGAAVAEFIKIKRVKSDLDPQKVVRVERGPFSLSFVIKKEEYLRVFGDRSVGLHFTDTPFNAVMERDAGATAGTIHHENIHNLTDGAVVIGDPIGRFRDQLERYREFKEKYKNDPGVLEMMDKRFLRLLTSPQAYIDTLHGEVVAAFEQAEDEGFISDDVLSRKEFTKRAVPFRTAGRQAIELVNEIKKQLYSTKDNSLKSALASLIKDVEGDFVDTVKMMKKYLLVAEHAGGAARDEVETLFYLLRPSQYRHIKSYLHEYYGKESFDESSVIDDLSEFNHLGELERGVELLRRKPELATPELLGKINHNFFRFSSGILIDRGELESLGIFTLEDLRKFSGLAGELAVLAGKNGASGGFKDLDPVVGGAYYAFMDRFIAKELRFEFKGLKEFYGELNDDEKEELQSALIIYMEFIGEDLNLEDTREIMERPMWKEFEAIGVADELRKIIE